MNFVKNRKKKSDRIKIHRKFKVESPPIQLERVFFLKDNHFKIMEGKNCILEIKKKKCGSTIKYYHIWD